MSRNQTDTPILDVLANRWSPRGFDVTHDITEAEVDALLEAARWTPSAMNLQPWRFAVAHRGTERFDVIADALAGFNRSWAPAASVLLVAFAVSEQEGRKLRWAEYDLGQAVAHLTLQAESMGLSVLQMGGFDAATISAGLGVDPALVPVTVSAIGRHGLAADDEIRARDTAPRIRKPAADLLV